jgi:hypothetical protein
MFRIINYMTWDSQVLDVNHVLVPLPKEKIVDLVDGGGKSHLKRNVDFTLTLVKKISELLQR